MSCSVQRSGLLGRVFKNFALQTCALAENAALRILTRAPCMKGLLDMRVPDALLQRGL